MHRPAVRTFLFAIAASAATLPLAVNAADGAAIAGTDVVPMLIWMFVGVGVSALLLGTLYLFKRRIGGFPNNPTWVAPITIMRSSDLPGDRDPHEATSDDGHGGHAPAH